MLSLLVPLASFVPVHEDIWLLLETFYKVDIIKVSERRASYHSVARVGLWTEKETCDTIVLEFGRAPPRGRSRIAFETLKEHTCREAGKARLRKSLYSS